MVIGKFGKHLTFEVFFNPSAGSEDKRVKYLTFENFHRDVSNRITEHERISKKQKVEFNGPSLSEMNFTIRFSAGLGVKPREMLKKLESCVRLGKLGYFIIGTKKIGKHKYLITHASESWNHIIKDGKLVSADVDITMKEYL